MDLDQQRQQRFDDFLGFLTGAVDAIIAAQTISLAAESVGLGNLVNLQILYLFNNQITVPIPTALGNLSNLETLWLIDNQLTGSIPIELGNLSSLTTLWLANNRLTGMIPAEFGNLSNLWSLRLYNNQLSGLIPPEFGNLYNLQLLDLSNNKLNGIIPVELANLDNLSTLDLNYNMLTTNNPDLATITGSVLLQGRSDHSGAVVTAWEGGVAEGNYLKTSLVLWPSVHAEDIGWIPNTPVSSFAETKTDTIGFDSNQNVMALFLDNTKHALFQKMHNKKPPF